MGVASTLTDIDLVVPHTIPRRRITHATSIIDPTCSRLRTRYATKPTDPLTRRMSHVESLEQVKMGPIRMDMHRDTIPASPQLAHLIPQNMPQTHVVDILREQTNSGDIQARRGLSMDPSRIRVVLRRRS
jgi:hypothetical protein